MAPRPCWDSGMGLGHDNGLTLAGERFGAREKSQANQNREKTAATLWPHFCVHSHISNYGGGQKTAAVFSGFRNCCEKIWKAPMRFFPGGLSRRPQGRLHPGTTRTPQEVAPQAQGNQASPGGHKRVPARELQESLREPSGSLREFPGASGSLRELLGASRSRLGASGSFQELLGTFGSLGSLRGPLELLGTSESFQKLPKASGSLPGASGSFWESPKASESLLGAFGNLWEPRKSFWEPLGASWQPPGTSGSLQETPGASGSLWEPPESLRMEQGPSSKVGSQKSGRLADTKSEPKM